MLHERILTQFFSLLSALWFPIFPIARICCVLSSFWDLPGQLKGRRSIQRKIIITRGNCVCKQTLHFMFTHPLLRFFFTMRLFVKFQHAFYWIILQKRKKKVLQEIYLDLDLFWIMVWQWIWLFSHEIVLWDNIRVIGDLSALKDIFLTAAGTKKHTNFHIPSRSRSEILLLPYIDQFR